MLQTARSASKREPGQIHSSPHQIWAIQRKELQVFAPWKLGKLPTGPSSQYAGRDSQVLPRLCCRRRAQWRRSTSFEWSSPAPKVRAQVAAITKRGILMEIHYLQLWPFILVITGYFYGIIYAFYFDWVFYSYLKLV